MQLHAYTSDFVGGGALVVQRRPRPWQRTMAMDYKAVPCSVLLTRIGIVLAGLVHLSTCRGWAADVRL